MSSDQLKRITEKLQELVKKFENVKRENERLKSEIIPAKQREMAFMEQVAILEQKVMVLKTGANKLEEKEKKELDKKLHSYLKEIDKCITILSE
jgi:cobalamin biosynthesis Mg chelatase CobN